MSHNMPGQDANPDHQTGWQRVAAVFQHALQPVDNPDEVGMTFDENDATFFRA